MDKITKNMLNEYLAISNISKNLLSQRFSSAIVCGEFSELVLKYVIQEHSNNKTPRTHNFNSLLNVVLRTNTLNPQLTKDIQKLLRNAKIRSQLINLNYTNYRYKEVPRKWLNLIFTVYNYCVDIFYEINT